MRVDANVKDKMDLVPGLYVAEIINAKENTSRKGNAQLIVEFQTIAGPDYENGEPSDGHEITEFLTLSFEGYEAKGAAFLKGKLQDFVAGLGKTMEEFRDLEAEDLIGEKVNILVVNKPDKNGFLRPQIDGYKIYSDVE